MNDYDFDIDIPEPSAPAPSGAQAARHLEEVRASLPLLVHTPARWAELAAAQLDVFLPDHAICEQQAAVYGLSLIGHYPDDVELVEQMGALAAEEVSHLRRLVTLMKKRGMAPSKKRTNPWVAGLRKHLETDRAETFKVDRLLVGALIEARSCERFSTLMTVVAERDPEVARLLRDLGPAEKRHWQMFHRLAARELPAEALDARWQRWLEVEGELSRQGGVQPTVHG